MRWHALGLHDHDAPTVPLLPSNLSCKRRQTAVLYLLYITIAFGRVWLCAGMSRGAERKNCGGTCWSAVAFELRRILVSCSSLSVRPSIFQHFDTFWLKDCVLNFGLFLFRIILKLLPLWSRVYVIRSWNKWVEETKYKERQKVMWHIEHTITLLF